MIRKGLLKYRKWAVLLLLALTLLCVWMAVHASDVARWPQEPGKNIKRDGNLKIDIANASEGYFQASLLDAGSNKYKMRVARGNTTLTYNLNNKAEFEIVPLQLGDGNYEVTLYKNVSGNKYSQAGRITFSAKLSSKYVCFLYPNQYVNYTIESEAVKKSDELCAGMTEKQAKFPAHTRSMIPPSTRNAAGNLPLFSKVSITKPTPSVKTTPVSREIISLPAEKLPLCSGATKELPHV